MKQIKSRNQKQNLIVVSITTKEKETAEKEIKKAVRRWNRLFGKFDYEIIIR